VKSKPVLRSPEIAFWSRLKWLAAPTAIFAAMPIFLFALHTLGSSLSFTSTTLVLLLTTVLLAIGNSIWVSILLSLESSLFLNYFLTPPYHSFRMSSADDVISLIFFLFSSLSVSVLVKALTTRQKEIETLLKRFDSLKNRTQKSESENYVLGDWLLDISGQVVQKSNDGPHLHFTPIEWRILVLLVKAQGDLVSQETVLKTVWGEKYANETNYLRLYMSQLRKKLEDQPKRPTLLLTESGSGYRAMSSKLEKK